MDKPEKKSIGSAIDEIISALTDLDDITKLVAVKAACELLGINLGISNNQTIPIQNQKQPITDNPEINSPEQGDKPQLPIQDIRSFKDDKQPSNGIEMACLVAYYLENLVAEDESSVDIGKADLEKYFKQASFPLPKVPSQTLVDAKSAGYFDSTSKRGRYKLNPVGYNLVAHTLPRSKK